MNNLFFKESKINYFIVFLILLGFCPIFINLDLVNYNLEVIKSDGYISQIMGYAMEDFVGIALPLSLFAFSFAFLTYIFSKNYIFNLISTDLIVISILSIFAVLFVYFKYNFLHIRILKSSFAIIFFLLSYNFFNNLINSFSKKQYQQLITIYVFFSNLVVVVYLINTFITTNKIFFIFNFSNYQWNTYFPYFLYLVIFINLNFCLKNKGYVAFFLSLLPFIGLINIQGGFIIIYNFFPGYSENYFVGVTFYFTLSIIIFHHLIKFLNLHINENKFYFINLFLINVLVFSFLSFGYFYGYINQVDERVRNFFYMINDVNYLSFFGIYGNPGKVFQGGTAHNDILELYSIFGIFIFIVYYRIYKILSKIYKKNDILIYSSLISVIFIGGLSTTVLMSFYLNYFIAITLAIYANQK